MANISLRTWDEFLLNKDLTVRKNNFITKYWSQNIFYFPNPEDNISEILETIVWSGLFTAKKLVIINNLPRSSDTGKTASEKIAKIAEYIIANYQNISNDSTICLVSPKPDGRSKVYKDLSAIKEITKKEYIYSEQTATEIIKQNCPEISNEAIRELIYISDNNLYKIYNESYKLGFLNKKISIDDINNFVENAKEVDPFGLLWYMIKWDKEKIIWLINNKSSFSDDISEFLGAVRWTLRIAILYYEASQVSSDSKYISENTKLSPMQSWQLRNNAARLNQNIYEIKNKYQNALDIEYNLKTWLLPKESSRLSIKQLLLQ